MSDTPRTDAYCKQILEDGLGLEYAATELQHFAEKLERELADARAELAEAKAKITMLKGEAQYGVNLFQRVIHAERELAETKKDAESTIKESLTGAKLVAWRYQNGITETEYLVWKKGTGGRNWTPLYAEPLPCPTCQSLARTVMMDQTGKA